MLSSLHIENIAVIRSADVDFSAGFNVLTGETGAGKSILVDSINLILGGRATRDIIRSGEAKASVSAVFTDVDEATLRFLAEAGIDAEDGTVLFRRDITADGKSYCRINDKPVVAATLRGCAAALVDIHGQHDSRLLMLPERHMDYIDAIGDCGAELASYGEKYAEYTALTEKIDDLKRKSSDRERRLELISFQCDEIAAANIRVGEEDELNERKALILNRQRIISALSEAKEKLSDSEEGNAVDAVYLSRQLLDGVSSVSSELAETAAKLEEVYFSLRDAADRVSAFLDSMDEGESIDEVEERLDVIYKMKHKYGGSEAAVLEYYEKINEELGLISDFEGALKKLEAERASVLAELKKRAEALSAKRAAAAARFEREVLAQLRFLDMPNVVFNVKTTPCEYFSGGAETCEFLISVNPGEPPKPIIRIASGGELSRIMLAIKTALAEKDDVATIIFDEIDTGISGRAADKIALKMKEVSRERQVFAVTHLAQIAAYADRHLLIEKNVIDGGTYTTVAALDRAGRIEELARIIGGSRITETTKESAAEMLSQAQSAGENI
ncbi:MAG: DNA repair protein RecN [Clostridia bacterium]|nr:DNA repair protein RecN [Clostridia bacterium]